jgi:hypothetical protein
MICPSNLSEGLSMKMLPILLLAATPAMASPFLYADPYPSTSVQPDSASLTVNGGSPVACILETVTAGIRPKCDLSSITTPGTYTLVMTVTKSASITSGTNTATNTAGSSASSAPFSYRLITAPVAGPALRVAP